MRTLERVQALLKSGVQRAVIGSTAVTSPDEVIAVELKATAEIVEVDKEGRDLKVTYVVEKCVKSSGDKDEEILPKGKIFTAAVGPGPQIQTTAPPTMATTLNIDEARAGAV